MEYQQCTRCVMDTVGDNTIRFEADGTCNYCNDTLRRKDTEYFPNEIGQAKLEALFNAIKEKGKGKSYDCMIGISGGLDSSYLAYVGHQYGLRMLGVHIDDGFDTEIASSNIHKLCEKAGMELHIIRPDHDQYVDVIRSFLKAGLPQLCLAQDNILFASLFKFAKENRIEYILSGANFALECILQRGNAMNAFDKKHILAVHKKFGESPIDKLALINLWDRYIKMKYVLKLKTVRPLDYLDYNRERAFQELREFSEFADYGAKHHESVLTRFTQCYYLPEKFQQDKRKSHLSSMIVSGQMKREDALRILEEYVYNEKTKMSDFSVIKNSMNFTDEEFNKTLAMPTKLHSDYPHSLLHTGSRLARKMRKVLFL